MNRQQRRALKSKKATAKQSVSMTRGGNNTKKPQVAIAKAQSDSATLMEIR